MLAADRYPPALQIPVERLDPGPRGSRSELTHHPTGYFTFTASMALGVVPRQDLGHDAALPVPIDRFSGSFTPGLQSEFLECVSCGDAVFVAVATGAILIKQRIELSLVQALSVYTSSTTGRLRNRNRTADAAW